MTTEVKGTKETKELLRGLLAISKILSVQFKDGIQASDAVEIVKKCMTPELEALIVSAYNGANEVPLELKDISLAEALEMIKELAPEVLELVAAVRGTK